MIRARSNRGGTRVGLLVGLLLGVGFSAGVLGVFLWFLNGVVSSGLEGYLRTYVFDRPEATFETVRVDVWRGRLRLTDLRLKGERLSLSVPEIKVDIPFRELLAGRGVVRSLHFENPLVEFSFSFKGVASGLTDFSQRFPVWVHRLPISEISITHGQVRLVNRDSNGSWGLRQVEARLTQQGRAEGIGGAYQLKVDGINESELPGAVSVSLEMDRVRPGVNLNGECSLKNWPIDPLARFLTGNGDVRVTDGRVDLKTSLTCKDDWLTASHLVQITDLKVEVSSSRKEILGLSVKRFKDVMAIPYLSFVVPMNGSIRDPHVGIASSVQQILYKVLEGKIEDKKNLEKWARRGGDYIGAKIDRSLRDGIKTK
ncbi:MAG: hypothetical protein JNK54_00660 [Elusimicrobia bacterium]|jgi:hypothetical protein|nr:hypothetical protein [Elusimicrobiota bacterium]